MTARGQLKLILALVLALAALAATAAASAQAVQFHCSVEPCRITLKPDGTGKTAHQVFVEKNEKSESASLTCGKLSGEATSSGKAASELTVTGVSYTECNIAGVPATVRMNGCDFLVTAEGYTSVHCPSGKEVEFEVEKCLVKIPVPIPVVGLAVKFHNLGEKKEEITVETTVKGIEGTASGSGCPIGTGAITGEYTTGNVILTGETDPGGVMANAWWE